MRTLSEMVPGEVAVRTEHLSKLYRLGLTARNDMLRDQLAQHFRRLVRRQGPTHAESKSIWALKDVSLEVNRGEVVGIVGPNGAGKSTLLKLLSRVTAPTSGRAEVYGRVGSLLEVGTGFHPDLTGRENIYLSGAILGMRKAEIQKRFDEIVEFAQVERFVDTPVKRYSSGMYLRLGFAIAAHLEPEILIVDEVLAVGDAAFQKKSLGRLNAVAQEGRAVLFTSHNMTAVSNLCNRVYRLDHGRMVDSGPTLEVIRRYLGEEQPMQAQDLTEHRGRQPGFKPLLRSIRLLQDGVETATFTTSGPFELEAQCAAEPDQELAFGFEIRDQLGTYVLGSNLRHHGPLYRNRTEHVVFRAAIDELVLSPGTYTISLFLATPYYDLDVIENALSFDVLWTPRSDFPHPPRREGVDVRPGHRWPLVFVPVRWEALERDGS